MFVTMQIKGISCSNSDTMLDLRCLIQAMEMSWVSMVLNIIQSIQAMQNPYGLQLNDRSAVIHEHI